MAPTQNTSLRRVGARLLVVLTLSLVAVSALQRDAAAATTPTSRAPGSSAYGWPIKPFFGQHPVRGFFGDPRIGMTPKGMTHTFHFGIDIACPNGTPVYATVTGTAVIESFRPETVAVVAADGDVELQYWHIEPSVRDGQHVVAYRTIVGRVEAPWAHVHFSELRGGAYVNPLRPGAMRPYVDTTKPRISSLSIETSGSRRPASRLSGRVDLVVSASDTTPMTVPGPWRGKPVTPAFLRWRVLTGSGHAEGRWTVGWDVRKTTPDDAHYDDVYARWTRQNKAHQWGRYRFYLARGWDTATLGSGRYLIEVESTDTRGNRTNERFPITIAHGSPAATPSR